MRRSLRGSVVVVIGATSGIGRSTALGFARCGARLGLAARDTTRLAEVAAECTALGAEVTTVVSDVADESASEETVRDVVDRFGRVDTWVNCAAGLVAGDLPATPAAELARLVETNVVGALYSSRAALGQFERQGHGVLINVASLLAVFPNPRVPAYVMTKFAVRGLSLSLRYAADGTGIRVCVVLPGPVDTPMFAKAGNHAGRALRAIAPACSVERAAATIIGCARRPRRQVVVGWTGRAAMLAHRFAPAGTEWFVAHAAAWLLVRRESAAPTPGGLFEWSGPARSSGGWRRNALRRRLGDAVGAVRITRSGHIRARRRHAERSGLACG
jgi:short-subunit dehydrogenase